MQTIKRKIMKISTLEQLLKIEYPNKVYEVIGSRNIIKQFIVIGLHPRDKKSVIVNETSSIKNFEVWSENIIGTKLHYLTDDYDEAKTAHVELAEQNFIGLRNLYGK